MLCLLNKEIPRLQQVREPAESDPQREARLQQMREHVRDQRAAESDQQREARLQQMSNR